jgi:hypothetical protein
MRETALKKIRTSRRRIPRALSTQGALLVHRTRKFIEEVKTERRHKADEWTKREAEWQRRLTIDLDASIGKMTYDEAFRKLGPAQMSMVTGSQVIAVWQSGRVRRKWFPVDAPAILSLFPHGFRLELSFNETTRLVTWNYSEW